MSRSFILYSGGDKIGAIPIPVNTMLTPDDYEYYLNDSRAKAIVVSEQLLDKVRISKAICFTCGI